MGRVDEGQAVFEELNLSDLNMGSSSAIKSFNSCSTVVANIVFSKQRNKNINCKNNISNSVKALTSAEHQKRWASNILVSVKHLKVSSGISKCHTSKLRNQINVEGDGVLINGDTVIQCRRIVKSTTSSPSYVIESYEPVGARGDCTLFDTSYTCRDNYEGQQIKLRADVQPCYRPVKVTIHLEILGESFEKEVEGNQDISLVGFPISGKHVLTVKAEPTDNRDVSFKVGIERRGLLGIILYSKTVISTTISNPDCNALVVWWRSLSIAAKSGTGVGGGILLLLLISGCCCCCCKRRSDRRVIMFGQPAPNVNVQNVQVNSQVQTQIPYKRQFNGVV